MDRILLVEDEKNLAFSLQLNLQAEGFFVNHVENGREAIQTFSTQGPFKGVILDILLPEVDGFEVAKSIRRIDAQVGLIMLTARAGDEDRLEGLSIGADDYITKPFHLKEFLMKVKRMVQRSQFFEPFHKPVEQRCGNFVLNESSLMFSSPQGNFQLTALEADLLKTFMQNPGHILSRSYLLKEVWGVSGEVETRTVDNFIARIRKFTEKNPKCPKHLESIRGKGYRFVFH